MQAIGLQPQRAPDGAASQGLVAACIGGGGSQRHRGASEVDACALSLGECGRALQQLPAVIDSARIWLDAGPGKYPA